MTPSVHTHVASFTVLCVSSVEDRRVLIANDDFFNAQFKYHVSSLYVLVKRQVHNTRNR